MRIADTAVGTTENIKDANEEIREVCLHYWNAAIHHSPLIYRPHSTVGNMSGNRCESDCRSRGR